MQDFSDGNGWRMLSDDEGAMVSGGMMKLPKPVSVPVAVGNQGSTWGTVTDLPASEGIGIVIHF
jgi:hypothetical protein